MTKIAVFASSSDEAPAFYHHMAYELGAALALAHYSILYGAGRHGLMVALANGVIENGGQITGVIPDALVWAVDTRLCEKNSQQHLIITADIERRKDILIDDSDVIIALPGGVGTFEELYEAAHRGKMIILLSPNHYYAALSNQHLGADPFIHVQSVPEVMRLLELASPRTETPIEQEHLEHINTIIEKVHAINQLICVADPSHTFISVMTPAQYEAYQQSQSDPLLSETERLFLASRSIVLFEYNVPLTYAILHKMMTYNQLGFHGKHSNNKVIHKRVLLFSPTNPAFFHPTQQQLQRACEDKLLAEKHYSGLATMSCIEEAIRVIHEDMLTL